VTDICCIVLEVGIVPYIKHFRWRYGTVRCPWGAILALTATLRTIVTSIVSSTQRDSDFSFIMCILSIGSVRFNRYSEYNLGVFHDSLYDVVCISEYVTSWFDEEWNGFRMKVGRGINEVLSRYVRGWT